MIIYFLLKEQQLALFSMDSDSGSQNKYKILKKCFHNHHFHHQTINNFPKLQNERKQTAVANKKRKETIFFLRIELLNCSMFMARTMEQCFCWYLNYSSQVVPFRIAFSSSISSKCVASANVYAVNIRHNRNWIRMNEKGIRRAKLTWYQPVMGNGERSETKESKPFT